MLIKTDLDTLSEVYELLDEVELGGLMTGAVPECDVHEIVGKLLKAKRIKRFILLVTDMGEDEAKAVKMPAAMEIFKDFFVAVGSG